MTVLTDPSLEPSAPAATPDASPSFFDGSILARLAGYSWPEIQGHIDDSTDAALAHGYTQEEVDKHLGYQGAGNLSDQLATEAKIAIADTARDGVDAHAIEAASRGVIPAPDKAPEPEPDHTPGSGWWHMAQSYARSLMSGETKGPEDFAQTYTQSVLDAAVEPGSDPFNLLESHRQAAAASLASQLPSQEDLTDHAIALVHTAGHAPDPDLVNLTKENLIDRWAYTGYTPQQSFRDAQNDPDLADALTRERPAAVPPTVQDLEMPKRDEVVDPFNAVDGAIQSIIAQFPGAKEVNEAQAKWEHDFAEAMKPDPETGHQPTWQEAFAKVGKSPLIESQGQNFLSTGSLGEAAPVGMSARFHSRLLTHLNAAGKEADPAAATEKVLNENADEVMRYRLTQQMLGEVPNRPRNEAEAEIRFNRGDADHELAVATARLEQYRKAVNDALPAQQETIKNVQAAGSFKDYLDNGGKLDDLTLAKLYVENRARLGLQNPFPEDHPLYSFADTLRGIHWGIQDRLQANPLFDGMGFHEDYYRHLWTDPNAADRLFGSGLQAGREGSVASTRAREIPTEMQGIERGLTPKIPDPIANTLQYMQGLLYHEATLNTLAMGRSSGTIRWSPSESVEPVAGYERLQGKTANTPRSWTGKPKTPDEPPGTALVLWQQEHLPETGHAVVPISEGGPVAPEIVAAAERQHDANRLRIENLKNEIAVQEANGQDVTVQRQELEQRQTRFDKQQAQIEDMRAQPKTPTETELNRPTSSTLRPTPEVAEKLVSYAWAPAGYARAYNSWVGRGFYDHKWLGPLYTGLQYMSNMMNGLKLSLSGYHLANIAQETGVAGIARAYGNLARGELKDSLLDMGFGATILPEMGRLWKVGKDFESAYLRTGGAAVDPALVELFAHAGGRVGGRAKYYKIDARDNLVAAFRSGALKNELRADFKGAHAILAPFEYMGRAMDSINAPLFDNLIPRIKQGAWAKEMADWLHTNPTADRASQLSHARRIMDSIDDRFGEMNQDNLFWNRYAKQALNLLTVSIGWEFGTLRAFGHAGFDIGTRNWSSTRARWLPAFLTMTALQNGMSQYLHTGTFPNNAANWILGGQTGGQGGKEMSAWPSYGKEIINAVQMAYRTQDFLGALQQMGGYIAGKENTFWQFVKQTMTDKDWDDTSLRLKWEAAHGAPPSWFDAAFLAYQLYKAVMPINFQQMGTPSWFPKFLRESGTRKADTHISKLEQFFGERALSKQLSDPKAYAATMKYLHDKDLQAEAARELKAEQKLESPDEDKIAELQQTLANVKAELANERIGSSGGSREGHTRIGSYTYNDRTGASEDNSGGATVLRGGTERAKETVRQHKAAQAAQTAAEGGIVVRGTTTRPVSKRAFAAQPEELSDIPNPVTAAQRRAAYRGRKRR